MFIAEVKVRSWFVVFNNPEQHGYTGTPKEICDRLKAEWCITEGRTGAWAYSVKHYCNHYPVYDEDGKFQCYRLASTEEELKKVPPDLHHVHMVLEDKNPIRFSVIKNTYAIGAHFEATKGTKAEAEDYIAKIGDYDEKAKRDAGFPWEENYHVERHGEIRGRQGQRSDIQNIATMLKEGMTPKEILRQEFSYYRYQSMIKSAFFDKRDRETPSVREVTVIWHCGESGSGKSFSRQALQERVGEDEIYYLTDFGSGMWDGYNGQAYLWIEDLKGEIRFGDLLRYLDVYKADLHARYANAKALWREVHITSVMHPLGVYHRMLKEKEKSTDKADQLLRRIKCLRYHYRGKDENGESQYKYKDFPTSATLEAMRCACLPVTSSYYKPYPEGKVEFVELKEDEELPF